MAYLHEHTRDLFRLVASSDAPPAIATTARQYANLEIDATIPDLAWAELTEAIESARWPGKRALWGEISRRTRGGG